MELSATLNGRHLLRDWGLHIENNDIISPPEVNDTFISVHGGKDLDLTEMNGPVSYKNREINLELGGLKQKREWRSFFTRFLNTYHGKQVQIIFDDDAGFFYKGRAYIPDDAEKVARIGTFKMEIHTEPYKYEILGSQEPWIFDIFNFQTGVIRYIGEKVITSTDNSIRIPKGDMLTVPVFIVSQSAGLKVVYRGKEYALGTGRNRFPQIKIGGTDEILLVFKGTGIVIIEYRGGSL
ncbi:hypothetical protein EAI89_06780 [Eubacterium sp. am_0171]|uniref:Phage-related protein n=1 Tax=Faecalicatena contorta TaxID=39482 RepID=A0A174CJW2_9FIRM|nr:MULTISPECIES: hypothetical protein [Clostridia]MSC84351.1 hypothetical protein [Eubacterium sp. BIOML-A1]MSD05897.1 hypothetical protein [Eubacterium sp. BIOML-A2]RYT23268.1 hypothetical protein EAI89_06780 [Eubacterium sp. am_0171]CUO13652.1 Uncharacterised protein [[Eubacterium] contortum] [Faecalicatena contorta]